MKKIQDMKIDINTMCNFEKNTGRSLMKAMKDESFGSRRRSCRNNDAGLFGIR